MNPKFAAALQQLEALKKLEVKPKPAKKKKVKLENIEFTVVYNIPVNPNTDEYILQLMKAAALVGSLGMEVKDTSFELPEGMTVG